MTLTVRPCGFKDSRGFGVQHELTKVKRAAGSAWTRIPVHVWSIKPPEIAVAVSNVPDLLGGRLIQTATHEHDTTVGGIGDE